MIILAVAFWRSFQILLVSFTKLFKFLPHQTINSFKDDDGSEDVWTLEERVIYRWKGWKLIRTGSKTSKTDYLFIWSDAVVLRFKCGFFCFLDSFNSIKIPKILKHGRQNHLNVNFWRKNT